METHEGSAVPDASRTNCLQTKLRAIEFAWRYPPVNGDRMSARN